jgi:two-component sensor histidine kinase
MGREVFPGLRIDLTSVLLSLSMLIFTFGLLRHHLLEAVPIAREYLIENLKDGIVVIDNQNRIVDYNKASETILNMDKHYFARPADYILSALNIPSESLTSQVPTEYELEYRTGDKTMYYNLKVDILYDRYNQYRGRLFHFQDITVLKEKENTIRKLLQEKEFLLKEVHHRIKNNMGSVMGLLNLQASRANDQTIKNVLSAARNRIQSNLILYDRLYRSESFSELSAKDYIQSLAHEIMNSCDFDHDVKVNFDIEDFMLQYNIFFPLGIILNEILTNAIKYAFEGIEEKIISLQLTTNDKSITLIIKDNGIGLGETIEPDKSPGFGLQLVDMMIRQMNGTMKIIKDRGTAYQFQFNSDLE